MAVNKTIYRWANHLEINFASAAADYDAIRSRLGDTNTIEYMELKMNGDTTTSLKSFGESKGYFGSWIDIL